MCPEKWRLFQKPGFIWAGKTGSFNKYAIYGQEKEESYGKHVSTGGKKTKFQNPHPV